MGRQDWRTPRWLFDWLSVRFGPFDLDAAADENNALCENYHTDPGDGTIRSWEGYQNVFCNPPFSKAGQWVEHARRMEQRGARCVMIAPSSVNSRWFHSFLATGQGSVLLPSKRIAFTHPDEKKSRPDRDSIILLFGRFYDGDRIRTVDLR